MTPDLASVDTFVGSYHVEDGRMPDGTAYAGTMRVVRKGVFLHAEADLDLLGTRHGLALPFGRRLVMTFGPKDKVEIGAYALAPDGRQLRGLWVPPGAAGDDLSACGREESGLASDGRTFEIQQAVAIDGQPYTGSLTIDPHPAPGRVSDATPVRMTWRLHDGEYQSFGLAFADAIFCTFSFEPEKPYGIAVYESARDVLKGTWLASGAGLTTGAETLRRPPR